MRHYVGRALATTSFLGAMVLIGSALAFATHQSREASAFDNIAAATEAKVDSLDATTAAEIQSLNGLRGSLGSQRPSEARTLAATVDGRHVYLIPSANGALCIFTQSLAEACTTPLSAKHPATFGVTDLDGAGGVGPIVHGVAMDGVASVSFTESGTIRSVPVIGNVFWYMAKPEEAIAEVDNAMAVLQIGALFRLRASRSAKTSG